MLADCHNFMKSIQPQWRLLRQNGLYLLCPMLALLLAVLHGSVCGGLLIHSLYGGVLLAALPTWDRQFLKRLAAGSSFLIILAEVLAHGWEAPDTLALANASIGLLMVWARCISRCMPSPLTKTSCVRPMKCGLREAATVIGVAAC